MCKVESKTDDHILVSCPFAKEVLIWIFKWCDIPLPSFSKVKKPINFACTLLCREIVWEKGIMDYMEEKVQDVFFPY